MPNTREIKGRIKAVANIQRITKTMQMIATSKFARAQSRATDAKPYTEGIFELVQELASGADLDHPLLRSGAKDAPELVLVMTSDRGMCGPYNNNALRLSLAYLRTTAGEIETELVGKKGVSFMRFAGKNVTRHHTHFGDNPHREDIDRLAEEYMERFIKGEISGVSVFYTRFISAGRQAPERLQLLPLKPPVVEGEESKGGTQAVYEFSPERDQLLDALLPAAVRATLNQCFSDAIVSEHVARMIAMKAATDAAGRVGKDLKRTFNRARQAQITTELTEIIGGVAALE
ncbi:MAG: ATP synthase F1 subunit gamma [Planctomycetota bacterium]|jgi:F-type H+-transporting ATPase subunit gamma